MSYLLSDIVERWLGSDSDSRLESALDMSWSVTL